MKHVYFIAGLTLGLIIALFAVQNTAGVEVQFLVWQVRGPMALVVLAAVAIGMLLTLLFGVPELLFSRWQIRSLQRRIAGISGDRRESPADEVHEQRPERAP
jgi:uncharacterized integral membrane protein